MRRYLLDTGLVTAYLRGRTGAVSLLQPWIDRDEATTSAVVYGEVIEYFKILSDFPRRQALLRALFRRIRSYDLTYAILEHYADLRLAMRPPRGAGLIGDVVTLIAATALEHDLTVVSLDSDFTRVPGLSMLHLTRDRLG
jgi:predicted nucleic acid-binding protein